MILFDEIGTIGGATVGVSKCTNIFGMKILSDAGSGSTSGIVTALDVVKQRHLSKGAAAKSVVSMSLGGTCVGSCATDSLVLAVQALADIGVISSIAAGNSNLDAVTSSPAAAGIEC